MLTAATDTDGDQQADKTITYGYTGTQQTSEQTTVASTQTSSAAYTYDLQGRMAVAEITTYTAGNPSRVERTSYEYDPGGIRVSKLSETNANPDVDSTFETRTLSEYLIDPANHTGYQQVLQETITDADTGTELKKVVYTIGHDVIAQTTFEPSGPTEGETLILHADGHGSTRVLTDLAGAIVQVSGVDQIFHFTAYGEALGFNTAQAATTLLYSGEQFDARIGKQYLRARYYSPQAGTFNRLDPFAGNLQDPQSLHKYLYVHANPVMGIDPTGLFGGIVSVGAASGLTTNNAAVEATEKTAIGGAATAGLQQTIVRSSLRNAFAAAKSGGQSQMIDSLARTLVGILGFLGVSYIWRQNEVRQVHDADGGGGGGVGGGTGGSGGNGSNKCPNQAFYDAVDSLGRATRVVAQVGTVVPRTNFRKDPPWWGQLPQAPGRRWRHGHMLAGSLGGKAGNLNAPAIRGSVHENHVAQTFDTNHTNEGMVRFENGARNAINSGDCLLVWIEADYSGNNYYPTGLLIEAIGERGYRYQDIVFNIF